MAVLSVMKIRAFAFVAALLLLASTAGCGSAAPPNAGVAELSALAAQEAPTAADDGTTGPPAPLLDPCTALAKADVQPFFSAEVVTALPALLNSDQEKSCEFAPTNKTSSLIVAYMVGDSAQTTLMMNQQPGSKAVSVPNVGDGANHPTGDPSLLFSWKGSGSTAVVCTVTTTGEQFALEPDSSATITDDQATKIDEQYGTLCNRLYGSGNTSPSVPQVSIASAAPLPSMTGSVLADSTNTMPGTGIPLPAGVDCAGDKTAKDTLLGLTCEQPIDDPLAIYTFYLTALPAHGYTINSQQYYPEADSAPAHASIMFTNTADGLCFISIIAGKLSISKQEN